jgi:hypothetical protein
LDRRLGRLQTQCGRRGEEKNLELLGVTIRELQKGLVKFVLQDLLGKFEFTEEQCFNALRSDLNRLTAFPSLPVL